MSDDDAVRQLIKQAQRGDSEAVSQLYQGYAPRIFRYIAYRVTLVTDAEDLTAEVFVRMVEGLPRYRDIGNPFDAWLFRIASARVADFHRKRGRRPVSDLSDQMADSNPLPEEQLLQQQEEEELRNALRRLNKDDQKVLILRFVERKSHQEVATIINKSISAVKSIQHRALLRLATRLGSEEKARHYLRGRNE
ncbi:MAG: sigma-70 family RNA polymerase sigma factor [Phycisphaerales bacterium]|jgi:RNA polymerase sigma-70 factor, ECF subfamily|nr:sigma-70 family RNA polymerase sigma factor [Phycisphaerales bacterium]